MKINTDIKSKTKVTFIMPVFNEEYKLANAIESILSQNYQLWFLILVNDASTDNSQKVINHYQKKDKRITCITNRTNKGLAYCLNKAIENCSTEYIARMDADDVAFPGRLEAQLIYLEKHPEIDVLGTAAEVVTTDGNKTIVLKPQNHNVIASSIEKINPILSHDVFLLLPPADWRLPRFSLQRLGLGTVPLVVRVQGSQLGGIYSTFGKTRLQPYPPSYPWIFTPYP